MSKIFKAQTYVPHIEMNPITGESSIIYEERESAEQRAERIAFSAEKLKQSNNDK